jgi:hypothetical protein
MNYKNKFILVIIMILPMHSYSSEIALFCKGKVITPGYSDGEYEFPFNFDDTTGFAYGFPNLIVPGGLDTSQPASRKCDLGSAMLNCSYSNSIWLSSIDLSRVTGKLVVTTFEISKGKKESLKSYSKGIFLCEKFSQRKF